MKENGAPDSKDSMTYKKKVLRMQVFSNIKNLLGENGKRKWESLSAAEILVKSRFWQNAASIFLFCSTDFEIDTEPVFFKGMEAGKSIFFPRIIKKSEMVFIRVWDRFCGIEGILLLEKNRFGIMEPPLPERGILPVSIVSEAEPPVLVLVPGRAFTKKGERLGLGGGFYDRYLKILKEKISTDNLVLIGYCFNEQVVDYVPCEPHDVKMDKILTPGGFIL